MAENISRFVGYVLVKDIFVEFILIVISNEDSFRFECTTPYDALSKILIKEIKTKLFVRVCVALVFIHKFFADFSQVSIS